MAGSVNNEKRPWSDEKMDELMTKGKANWDADDWDAYHYIQQLRYETGYYDDPTIY